MVSSIMDEAAQVTALQKLRKESTKSGIFRAYQRLVDLPSIPCVYATANRNVVLHVVPAAKRP